jgi:hypothetical protein
MRKLNFYSPFVPHIVEFPSGRFAVRKWLFGWKYYDSQKFKKDDYWWDSDDNEKFYKVESLEEAKLLLDVVKLRKQVSSNKPIRIHL